MSYAISVPTPFNDISELAENFASRVDDERLMLPHGDEVPEGEWVQFAVTLADGSAALSGLGRCTGSYDNGEERAPEHRFDVVMDSLQLEEMAQIYFERILQVRAAQMGEEPQTGEVDLPEEPVDVDAQVEEMAYAGSDEVVPVEAAAPVETVAEPPADEFGGEATQAVSFDELAEAAEAEALEAPMAEPVEEPVMEAPAVDETATLDAEYAEAAVDADAFVETAAAEDVAFDAGEPDWEEGDATQFGDMPEAEAEEAAAPIAHAAPALTAPEESNIYELPPPSAPGQLPSPHANGATLTRRMLQATWSPEPAPRPDPSPSSGYFQYAAGGLPQPPTPPRPELDPSLHVSPAPRPGDAHAAPEAFAEAAEPQAAYEEPEAYAEAEAYGDEEQAAYAEADEAVPVDDAFDAEGGYDEAPVEAVEEAEEVYDAETVEGEGLEVDAAFEDLSGGEAYEEPPVEAATREVDLGDLPDHALSHDDETSQVELPEEQQ